MTDLRVGRKEGIDREGQGGGTGRVDATSGDLQRYPRSTERQRFLDESNTITLDFRHMGNHTETKVYLLRFGRRREESDF